MKKHILDITMWTIGVMIIRFIPDGNFLAGVIMTIAAIFFIRYDDYIR